MIRYQSAEDHIHLLLEKSHVCIAALVDDLSAAEAEAHRETARCQAAADAEIESLQARIRALQAVATAHGGLVSPLISHSRGAHCQTSMLRC